MKIKLSETRLTGRWLVKDGRVCSDETNERIQDLIHSHLEKLGSDASGWDVLFQDPDDGRLWELTYPQSYMHGGGPPDLRIVNCEEAQAKYPKAFE